MDIFVHRLACWKYQNCWSESLIYWKETVARYGIGFWMTRKKKPNLFVQTNIKWCFVLLFIHYLDQKQTINCLPFKKMIDLAELNGKTTQIEQQTCTAKVVRKEIKFTRWPPFESHCISCLFGLKQTIRKHQQTIPFRVIHWWWVQKNHRTVIHTWKREETQNIYFESERENLNRPAPIYRTIMSAIHNRGMT